MPDQPAGQPQDEGQPDQDRVRPLLADGSGELVLPGDPDWEWPRPPSDEELAGYGPDDDAGPPDGASAWLATLSSEQLGDLAAELAGARPAAARESIGAGFSHRRAASGIAAGERGWEPEYVASRPAGPAAGFAAGGALDVAEASPVLASLAQRVVDAGLAVLSDDELVGLLGSARRLASWQAAIELTAAAELDARRRREAEAADAAAGRGTSSLTGDRIAAELAAALTLTGRAADGLVDLARALARLLPVRDMLMTGMIDLAKARVFAAELSALDDATANRIACRFLERAREWTTSQLRRALRAAVLDIDPAAAKRRADKALEDTRVETWQEGSGNAAVAGRELPAAMAIAADSRISRLARALRARGAAGTMDQLRAAVYLALLLGQDPGDLADGTAKELAPTPAPGGGDPAAGGLGGVIHLTLPAMTWLGLADRPGELAGLGPVDAYTGRDLARLLADGGRAGWKVTLVDQSGQAVAHARARPPPRAAGPPGQRGDPRVRWLAGLTFQWLELGGCGHSRRAAGYRPGTTLRRLLAVRNPTCVAPGCRRPAVQCDNEHTVPFDRGGLTCECNCAPMCRRHHRVKQSPGWRLAQPSPGVLVWNTPAGRTYTTHPGTYPI